MDLRQTLIPLFTKFAHLYDSGVPLAEALDLVRHELPARVGEAVRGIVDDIYRGTSLADAMERRPDVFGPEIVGIIRAGEQRGELGRAARSAADGLRGRVLDAAPRPHVDLDAILETAGDARAIHVEPDGRLRLRVGAKLTDAGEIDAGAAVEALRRSAAIEGGAGAGAFLWRDRLLRVAVTDDAAVVRVSAPPGKEPPEARKWRAGKPGLLVVTGGRDADLDGTLRSALQGFDREATKRVAVDLPVPEVTSAPNIDTALAQDPDVLCLARLHHKRDAERLVDAVESGVHVLAAASGTRLLDGVPFLRIVV